MAIIEVTHLTYAYPQTVAVNDVSFSIEAGTVTALVGPNGAGKTTLMNCLTSLRRPQTGDIHIDGVDVLKQPRLSHQVIGYLPDFFGLYEELTAEQCLRYMGMAQLIPAADLAHAIARAAEQTQITDLLSKKAGSLSRGQKQRLAIAQAIIHQPKILLLDEPAAGLDPEARHHLSLLFVEMAKSGMTLLVSSHILAELEDYCTHVMMIRDGKLIEQCEIKSAKVATAAHRVLVLTLSKPAAQYQDHIKQIEHVNGVRMDECEMEFEFTGDQAAQQELLKRLINEGLPVVSLASKAVKLQETYLKRMSES